MNQRLSSFFFFVLLLGAVLGVALIFRPFLSPIMLALAATVIVSPLYSRLKLMIGDGPFRNNLSASLTVILVLIVLLVPTFFLIEGIYGEVQTLYGLLIDEANRSQVIAALNTAWSSLSNVAFGLLPAHTFDSFNVTETLKSGLEWVFSNLDIVFNSVAKVSGYVLIFLLATFYFLRDGRSLAKMAFSWSPALAANEDYIIRTFKKTIRSVFAGTLVMALLEGLSTGLAFLVFGIPAPALWGTVAAVAALVPVFGVTLIILPGVAYLILTGNYTFAVGLFIWGYTVIILVDHLLGPYLINRGIKIHPFLILLSVLGGILAFGLIGFVMGPLLLVFLFTLLEIYRTSFNQETGN